MFVQVQKQPNQAHKSDGLRVPNVPRFRRGTTAVSVVALEQTHRNWPFFMGFSKQKKEKTL